MKGERTVLSSWILLSLLFGSAVVSWAQDGARSAGPLSKRAATELVDAALLKYGARELKAADYTWTEYEVTRWFYRQGPVATSDAYDVIPLGGTLYRRHLLHDDQRLAQQEEQEERDKLKAALRKVMDEEATLPAMEGPGGDQSAAAMSSGVDPLLADLQSGAAEQLRRRDHILRSVGDKTPILSEAVVFSKPLTQLRLPIEQLSGAFDIRWKRTDVIGGRQTQVLEAIPRRAGSNDRDAEAQNFAMTVWIDQTDAEIVRIEGKAIRSGVLSPRPEYAVMGSRNYPAASANKAKEALYDQSLRYSRGTRITREWIRIKDEMWLPKRLYVKGKVVYNARVVLSDGTVGEASPTFPFEHETTYLRYRKFSVHTRILPGNPQ